jgi:hypothetical protein
MITEMNAVFWDVTPRVFCFGGTYRLHHQGDKIRRARSNVSSNCIVFRLLVTNNVVPSSLIPVTLMAEAILFIETSVLTRATRRKIPADGILHSHRRENLKSYTDNRNVC